MSTRTGTFDVRSAFEVSRSTQPVGGNNGRRDTSRSLVEEARVKLLLLLLGLKQICGYKVGCPDRGRPHRKGTVTTTVRQFTYRPIPAVRVLGAFIINYYYSYPYRVNKIKPHH